MCLEAAAGSQSAHDAAGPLARQRRRRRSTTACLSPPCCCWAGAQRVWFWLCAAAADSAAGWCWVSTACAAPAAPAAAAGQQASAACQACQRLPPRCSYGCLRARVRAMPRLYQPPHPPASHQMLAWQCCPSVASCVPATQGPGVFLLATALRPAGLEWRPEPGTPPALRQRSRRRRCRCRRVAHSSASWFGAALGSSPAASAERAGR